MILKRSQSPASAEGPPIAVVKPTKGQACAILLALSNMPNLHSMGCAIKRCHQGPSSEN